MEKPSISLSPSALNRMITTEPISADDGTAFHGDPSSSAVPVSTLLSPSVNPVVLALAVPSPKENAEIVPGNLALGEQSSVFFQKEANPCPRKSMPGSETICDVLCDNTQQAEEDCVLVTGKGDNSNGGADNAKRKEEVSGLAIQSDGDSGGVANGKAKQEATGLKVLGAGSGKQSEKIVAVVEDIGCSLEIELIDDTAVIGISTIAKKKKKKVEREPLKEKKPRRRSRYAKKVSDENKNSSNLKVSTGNKNSTGCKRTEKVKKMVYSRKTMESMRFWNVRGQRRLWKKVYDAFSPTMRTEYGELCGFGLQNKPSGLGWDTHRAPAVLGMTGSRGEGMCLNYHVGGDRLPGFLWERRKFV